MSANSLPGNPHLLAADYGELEAAPFTQAQATLALAYEQRTANLIAILQPVTLAGGDQINPEPAFADNILAQIAERMGL